MHETQLISKRKPSCRYLFSKPCLDNSFEAREGAADDKQNICGVDGDVLHSWFLSSVLIRYVYDRSLQHFEQGLLDAFTSDVLCASAVGFGDLIDLIDKDDAVLCFVCLKATVLKDKKKKENNFKKDIQTRNVPATGGRAQTQRLHRRSQSV